MDDAITDLAPQRARDELTGAEVYNDGRDAITYELAGRRWRPFIERGRVDAVYEVQRPAWEDGEELSEPELAQARDVIRRVIRHWHGDVEFVRPDGSQVSA
jgi:hypothetical protein